MRESNSATVLFKIFHLQIIKWVSKTDKCTRAENYLQSLLCLVGTNFHSKFSVEIYSHHVLVSFWCPHAKIRPVSISESWKVYIIILSIICWRNNWIPERVYSVFTYSPISGIWKFGQRSLHKCLISKSDQMQKNQEYDFL